MSTRTNKQTTTVTPIQYGVTFYTADSEHYTTVTADSLRNAYEQATNHKQADNADKITAYPIVERKGTFDTIALVKGAVWVAKKVVSIASEHNAENKPLYTALCELRGLDGMLKNTAVDMGQLFADILPNRSQDCNEYVCIALLALQAPQTAKNLTERNNARFDNAFKELNAYFYKNRKQTTSIEYITEQGGDIVTVTEYANAFLNCAELYTVAQGYYADNKQIKELQAVFAELARKCNPTQKRIVKYLIHGLRPSQIADKMQYKTVQTVLNHIDRIAVLTAEIIDSNHSELIPLIDKVNGYKERTDKQTASKREYDRKREQTAERKATYKKREQTAERKAYKAQKARERRERDRLAKLQAK